MTSRPGLLSAGLLAAALACAALAPVSPAQGGGFSAGDLYVTGNLGGTPAYGLVRVDPLSGESALLSKFVGITGGYESLVFDPHRQRLVLNARVTPADGGLYRAYLADATGQLEPLGPGNVLWKAYSPTGDGRIYFHDTLTSVQPFKWLDAANQIHVLYDMDGVTPFLMDGFSTWLEDMIYVASENALFTVTSGVSPWTSCPGGNGSSLHVRKLPLSADGTRVSAPMSCAEYDVVGWDGETSHGFSLMSDGDLLLGGHTGVYGFPLGRLVRVDPSTMATSAFALFGDASNGGTTWSSALDMAVTQSHFVSGLLAYAAGQVDDGVPVSSGIAFGDTRYALDEIPALACDGAWIAYGAGLAGKGGLVPRLYGAACPEPGATFTLRIDQVVGGASGVIWTGLAAAAAPFKGGTFQVGALLLTVPIGVGGVAGSAGAGSLEVSTALPPDAALTGFSVFLQAAFADAAALQGISLTQGLEIEIG